MQGQGYNNATNSTAYNSTWRNYGVRTQKFEYTSPHPNEEQKSQLNEQNFQVNVVNTQAPVALKSWKDYGITVQSVSIKSYSKEEEDKEDEVNPKPPPMVNQPPVMQIHSPAHEQYQRKPSPVKKNNFNITLRAIGSDSLEYEYNVNEPSQNDWIGLYIHDREQNYERAVYTYGKKTGKGTFENIGNKGYYDVRYMRSQWKSKDYLAKSDPVLIGSDVTLKVTGEDTEELVIKYEIERVNMANELLDSQWWVGLYPAGQRSNNKYMASRKCKCGKPGEICLETPREPGNYEVRFFRQEIAAYSAKATFEVADKDKMNAHVNGNAVSVEWTYRTKEFHDKNYVALFDASGTEVCRKSLGEGKVNESKTAGTLFLQSGKKFVKGSYYVTFNVFTPGAWGWSGNTVEEQKMRINLTI